MKCNQPGCKRRGFKGEKGLHRHLTTTHGVNWRNHAIDPNHTVHARREATKMNDDMTATLSLFSEAAQQFIEAHKALRGAIKALDAKFE